MNCSQARILLAAYREYQQSQIDTTALDVHLEQCAACREVLAQQDFVGDRIRSLTALEPAPYAYPKLLQALAIEHARFMQQSPSTAASAPNFLKPYLKDHQLSKRTTDRLAAISAAETGPIPVLRTKQRRRSSYMGQFAALGLAATLLMVLMMGALTSLLLRANHGQPGINTVAISRPSQVAMAKYTTTTPYTHVVSAVANSQSIYYTAYNGTGRWMLEQLDSRTKMSTPLLSAESTSALAVLGSSNDWLVWLELDALKPSAHPRLPHHVIHALVRTWRLNALFIGTQLFPGADLSNPLHVLSGTFDPSTVPDWVHTPIQGSWLTQDTLFVAMIDSKGAAHLVRCQLQPPHTLTSTDIATASGGHILTSPTANNDGSVLYWSEEWLSADTTIHSNIWVQQAIDAVPPLHGYWRPHKIVTRALFRADEMSFRPEVVNDTLFFLSTKTATATDAAQATPGLTPTVTPIVTPATTPTLSNAAIKPRLDPTIYPPQLDEAVRGTLLSVPLDDDTVQPLSTESDDWSSVPQAGTRFLLWQSDKGYEMYDVVAKSAVTIGAGTVPNDALFLAVNGDTAVWIVSSDNSTDKADTSSTDSPVTFRVFNWPTKA